MPHARFEHRMRTLLAEADVRIDGDRPWDFRVHDSRVHARVLGQGSLGLGESYMDGWWDADALDGLLFRLLDARLDERVHGPGELFDALRARLTAAVADGTVGEVRHERRAA